MEDSRPSMQKIAAATRFGLIPRSTRMVHAGPQSKDVGDSFRPKICSRATWTGAGRALNGEETSEYPLPKHK